MVLVVLLLVLLLLPHRRVSRGGVSKDKQFGGCFVAHFWRPFFLPHFQIQTLGQKLDRALQAGLLQSDGVLPLLVARQLDVLQHPALCHSQYPEPLLELGELLAIKGSMKLLEVIGSELPLPTPKTIRGRLPPPIVESGIMPLHYKTLLQICAATGLTAGGCGTAPPVTAFGDGQLLQYDLALAVDGLQLGSGIGVVESRNYITGFTVPLTSELESQILALRNAAAVKQFEKAHDIFVSNVQVAILSRVDGACRTAVASWYTGRSSGNTESSLQRLEEIVTLTQTCEACITADGQLLRCVRACPTGDCSQASMCLACEQLGLRAGLAGESRPCTRCLQANIACVVGRVATISTDCAGGEWKGNHENFRRD